MLKIFHIPNHTFILKKIIKLILKIVIKNYFCEQISKLLRNKSLRIMFCKWKCTHA